VHVARINGAEARLPIYTEIADWVTYSAEVAAAVDRLNAAAPLDLIDFPEWSCEGYVHLLNRTEWNSIPIAIHLHGPLIMLGQTIGWPEKDSEFYRIGTEMERTSLRLADAVFSSSKCAAEWCAREYGLTLGDIPVIHTGVDTNLFVPCTEKPASPTVVFAGKLTRNKGVHLLVEACASLVSRFPDLRLRLVGRGELRVIEELRAIAASAGSSDLLELVGFVDHSNLATYLAAAHVFAAPSQYEGGPGLVYLEAMACGVPVIACAGSGASEVVSDGENGFLVERDDVESLTNALGKLLGNRELQAAMGARARDFVVANANSDECISRLESFYEAVVSRAKAQSGSRQ
jgi:glycosyltransferase involved in cell wall biosynthesis